MQVSEFLSLLNQTITSLPANVLADLVNSMNVQLASDLTDTFGTKATQDLLKVACSGDMVLDISPAELNTTTTSSVWTRTVTVTLKNAAGDTHTWYNKAVTSGCSIADTSGLGTATIPSTTLTFTNGVATKVVTGSAHLWDVDETDTLTVADITILGYTVTGGTSVETFAAA